MTRLISEEVLAVVTIWQEARGEPYEGKCAIGEVIRKRMKDKYSSDGTVSGTVLRPHQFSGWNTDDSNRIPSVRINDTDPIVNDCQRAWIDSKDSKFANGAVLYVNLGIVRPNWILSCREVVSIGSHTFFVPKL